MNVRFTSFPMDSNWVEGVAGEYSFSAKLFDEPSVFGIDEGRVSKLSIWETGGSPWNSIVSYDRGWDVLPATDDEKNVYQAVLEFLENSPHRFDD